jgi:AcrR family transcriptional regulator
MGITERREREKEQRRKDIIDAAQRVFFSQGYDQTTMDAVSEEAELSKGTLYLYFNTKEELYFAVMLRGLGILEELFTEAVRGQGTGLDQLKAIGRAYMKFFNDYHDHFVNLMFFEGKHLQLEMDDRWGGEFAGLTRRIFSIMIRAIQYGIEDGTIRKDLDPLKTSLLLWAQTSGVLQMVKNKHEIIHGQFDVEPGELIENHFDLLEAVLRPPALEQPTLEPPAPRPQALRPSESEEQQ